MATKRTWARAGITVLASIGFAMGAGVPMASAHGLGGLGHHHGGHHDGGDDGGETPPPVPPAPAGHYSSCGENGLFPLNPLVSGVVHDTVEPALAGVEGSLGGVTGGNLEEAAHAIDCSTVVPVENMLNYGNPRPDQLAAGLLYTYYVYAGQVCLQEGLPYTCVAQLLP